jgi:O-antigen/teichoic acid export membrane protein
MSSLAASRQAGPSPVDDVPPSSDKIVARLGVNSLAVFASYVLNTALGSLVAICLARHFGREEYGLFSTIYAYLSFFLVFQSLGVDTVVVRNAARGSQFSEMLGAAAGLRIVLSTANLLACWMCLPMIQPDVRMGYLIAIASLSFPLTFYPFFLMRNNVELRMLSPNLILGAWSIFYSAARLAMIWFGFSLGSFVIAGLLSDVAVFLIAMGIGRREGVRLHVHFDVSSARRLLSESWPVAVASVFLQICLRVDQIMLYRMSGAEEAGLYAAAVRVVEFTNVVPYVFVSSVFPILARLSMEDSDRRLGSATLLSFRAMAWAGIPLAIYLVQYGGVLVPLVFGRAFEGSTPMVKVLSASLVFSFANSILFNRLFATGDQRSAAILAVAPALLNAALNVPLIHRYGGLGAGIATLVAYGSVTVFAVTLPSSRRVGRMIFDSLVRPAIAGSVALATTMMVHPGPVLGGLILAGVFVAVLVGIGELSSAEVCVVRRAISSRIAA